MSRGMYIVEEPLGVSEVAKAWSMHRLLPACCVNACLRCSKGDEEESVER